MNIYSLLDTLQNTTLATMVGGGREGWELFFPIVETVHVIFLSIVFGSIVMIDTRLLGFSSPDSPVTRLSREVLPWTWTAFICAVISGTLLFISKPAIYYDNAQFRYKFLCMALAGINMAVFHFGAYRRVAVWDTQWPPPRSAQAAGALSIMLWMAVIFFGRWIGFTT